MDRRACGRGLSAQISVFHPILCKVCFVIQSSKSKRPMDSVPPTEGSAVEDEQAIRVRDANRALHPRKKRPSDSPSKQKVRNAKRKSTGRRHNIAIFCEESKKRDIFDRMDTIKISIGEGRASKCSTFQLIETVIDFYIQTHNLSVSGGKLSVGATCEDTATTATRGTDTIDEDDQASETIPEYQYCKFEDVKQQIFICAKNSISHLVSQVKAHVTQCSDECDLSLKDTSMHGHVAAVKCECSSSKQTMRWTSSPHVEGGKFLVNQRVAHGFLSSGVLPVQYERLCEGAAIGVITAAAMKSTMKDDHYCEVVDALSTESQTDALYEEMAATEASGNDIVDGIDIVTDARHCWRKNARFSDVICLGDRTHKCIRAEVVSKNDDPISQRHEKLGTERIYGHLTKTTNVKVHIHDKNASVSKWVQQQHPEVIKASDTWHATKGTTKELKAITTGAKKRSGITWHPQLSDKAGSIRTHIYYCMKRCDGNADKLRSGIDNIVNHYKNIHKECHEESPCRADPNYVPSKHLLKSPKAQEILLTALRKLDVYKNPMSYVLAKDTHYVESFNNALLIYQDKRIVFQEDSYRLRANLAIVDWNTNIGRPVVSVVGDQSITAPRKSFDGRKLKSKKSYRFRDTIFDRFMKITYQASK